MLKTFLYYTADYKIIATITGVFVFSGTLIFWIAFYPKFTSTMNKLVGVNKTLFAPVTTLFALTAAFLGASVWGNFQQINAAIGGERVAIINYVFTIESVPQLRSAGLAEALAEYVVAVVEDEWPGLSRGAVSQRTDKAFQYLMQKSVAEAQKPELSSVVSPVFIRSIEALHTARQHRIGFRYHNVETPRWLAMLFLGILAQLTVMITHLENRKKAPMAAAVIILSCSVISMTTLIALSVNPYDGIIQVSKEPIKSTLERMNLPGFDVSLGRSTMRPFFLPRQAPFFHLPLPSRSSLG